jgi:dienelactone hydrolase
VYEGYGRIIADRGAYAAVVDQPFHDMTRWPLAAADLATIIESVRKQPDVDGDRIAIWAFSAGALLVGGWLAASPDWLRCLALTYPVLALPDAPTPPVPPADLVGPGRPVVLTRVGKEEPARQATVDRFLARAHDTGTTVQVVDVPDGRHGFDMIDHTEQSRNAVRQAIDLVIGHLLG